MDAFVGCHSRFAGAEWRDGSCAGREQLSGFLWLSCDRGEERKAITLQTGAQTAGADCDVWTVVELVLRTPWMSGFQSASMAALGSAVVVV